MEITTNRHYSEIIHQVPFCAPFSASVNISTHEKEGKSLWALLPSRCRSSNVAAASVTCILAVVCFAIHLATMMAYSSLRGDILQRKAASSARKIEKRRKLDLRIMKEAADYALSMTTQERLRMAFAFNGLLTTVILLPVIVASTGVAYSLPFPNSVLSPGDTLETMTGYNLTISALFHVTLVASFCILLLMMTERYREIRKIHPDKYITTGNEEQQGNSFRGSTRGRTRNLRTDPDVIPKRDQLKLGKMQDTFLDTFQNSYTFLDLVMTLLVPLVSGVIATIAVAVFGGQFESYGMLLYVQSGRAHSVDGLISYGTGWFPTNVYTYCFTIGLLVVACIILISASLLKCHTLTSIAKYLPGYQHSKDLFKYVEAQSRDNASRSQPIFRMGSDTVRTPGVLRSTRFNRQDPDGLSIDEPDMESSMSSIPPPPVSLSRVSTVSLDNLSLPPPPRPESMIEPFTKSMVSFPSLPSMANDDMSLTEPNDDEIIEVKAEAFFGNIRQAKVAMIAFLFYTLLSAPVMILFAMGSFYSHDQQVTRSMGFTNTSSLPSARSRVKLQNSIFVEHSTGTLDSDIAELESTAANKKNWVTTMSAIFLIFYVIASVAPFFVYCAGSRKFRKEAAKIILSCLLFGCCQRCKRDGASKTEETPRTRTNKNIVNPRIGHSSGGGSARYPKAGVNTSRNPASLQRDTRYATDTKTLPIKLIRGPKRKEAPSITVVRNVSWGTPDHYGTAKM